ncbi:unnamed protein product [Candidula unifasciata]|uniref:Clathrin light chain n=1 Tax=Candidula unifasciata TaxID=100452 RepID=A0A8S3ZR22_9EUPU|nr:unnamed protein product [Candidula unifasciata]
MADFDAFESAPSEDVDPAADFLAREQSELAGLDDDNFGESSNYVNQDFGGFEEPNYDIQNVPDGGMTDFEMLGSSGYDFENAQVPVADSFGGSEFTSNGPSNMYEAISQQDTARAVPEKIQIWQEEQKARLEKKDAEEELRKKELKEKAKKELEDWYKHHAEQLEKTKENNRAAEAAFIKDRDESIPGQAWEKITRLCEFNPKNSKCTKDVTRFRSLLLQLKQTPLVR